MIKNQQTRRDWLRGAAAISLTGGLASQLRAADETRDPRWQEATTKGLNWLSRLQSSRGQWNTQVYPTAMAALAGTALIASGSTTTQGPYAKEIARTSDYLISKCRDNGLIGDPQTDARYTYGHGFAMLFLSQVLGEEGLLDRREELVEVLTKAVKFSGRRKQRRAAGAMFLLAKEMTLTKVRRRSRRSRACVVAATQGSRSAAKSSNARSSTSTPAKTKMVASAIAAARRAAVDRRSRRRLWRLCTTRATMTASTFPTC